MRFLIGVPESSLASASELYEEAFGSKFRAAIPDRAARIAIIRKSLVPQRAICALDNSELIGLAGFYHEGVSFTGNMTIRNLWRSLGLLSSLRAVLLLSLMERTPQPRELLMDGIAVVEHHRGEGIGTRLLAEVVAFGRRHGYDRIRLDVIDTNRRAQDLYLRFGFEVGRQSTYPYLKPFLGFGGSTEMYLPLS